MKTTRFLLPITTILITVLIASNFVGAGKVCEIAGVPFDAGLFFFPISYLLGDVMTEVYGYSQSRRVIWMAFGSLFLMTAMTALVLALPPHPEWPHREAYQAVFSVSPRIALGSLLGFWFGEFTNSFVMSKMKILTQGRHLWARMIGSTLVGEFFDSAIFYPIAFLGVWNTELLVKVAVSNYALKVAWEVIATPLTYAIIGWLKRAEAMDAFDQDVNYNPFANLFPRMKS